MPKKVGILSGTFDPVHNGHVAFAQAALESLDIVYFLPEKTPWRKTGCASYEDRVEMLELATEDTKGLHVLKIQDQEQFTVADTLPRLQKVFIGEELYMLMGSDLFGHLPSWPGVEELSETVQFIVGLREKSDEADLIEIAKKLPPSAHYTTIQTNEAHTSSSKIRQTIAEGKQVDLPSAVLQYIQAKDLYHPVY